MIVKEWKENQILSDKGANFIESIDGIERETEKAYLLNITIGWSGDIVKATTAWVPKSATMTEEEYENEMAENEKKMENGLDYNKKLNAFAKENGIKGIREMMRTVTLIAKIEKAGLAVPARA